MKLTVFYESICDTFGANTNTIKRKMREKILSHQFFILYNNINFYKYVCDASIFNQRA